MSAGKREAFAWRVHDSISDSTARVDIKSSIALAIEAAVLGSVISLSTESRLLAGISNWPVWLLFGGLACLTASVGLAVLVVMPQLRRRHLRAEYRSNAVYFGHLRLWQPIELAAHLRHTDHELDVLARQLVDMSKIVWRKHVWLQWSLVCLLAGVVLVAATYVLVVTGVAEIATAP